jgi:carbonic anhydrase
MAKLAHLFENNRAWASELTRGDPDFFERLVGQQSPEYVWIGCSDSRVPANQIVGLAPGELFVHRNVANVVVHTDLNCLSVLQFAVDVLHVKHVIVCGHYGCGGVRAAIQNHDMGVLNPWLGHIRDVYRLHRVELDALGDESALYDRLVELNAIEQCFSIAKLAVFQQSYAATGFPKVHAWVYQLDSGRLRDLPIDQTGFMRDLADVYRLTDPPRPPSSG